MSKIAQMLERRIFANVFDEFSYNDTRELLCALYAELELHVIGFCVKYHCFCVQPTTKSKAHSIGANMNGSTESARATTAGFVKLDRMERHMRR